MYCQRWASWPPKGKKALDKDIFVTNCDYPNLCHVLRFYPPCISAVPDFYYSCLMVAYHSCFYYLYKGKKQSIYGVGTMTKREDTQKLRLCSTYLV
jgi:hypothetical protein